ncbi:FxsA family protein [Candidatus Sulfurimonas marisnigri]|uniref:FxsA family protein n=1 Tax=Candidatus Sulfurimonas marisnigri TaxID=2740405 RepID=A0A7S7M219_9BACT|nr:FxsA family protein [Candidatus Sulfurimonas marisnigri]QOY55585.1 FxsA family protein [Candidatus Sulfurimonas marisnigri]
MIYFVVYLFLEVLVSVNISSYIGGLATFLEIMLSAFFGISILINFRKTLTENMTAVSYSCIDLEQFQRLNLFTILGGILLIIPGFLTDIFGILLQFSAFTTMAVNRYNVKSGNCKTNFKTKNIKKDIDVIDVEIISDNSSTK